MENQHKKDLKIGSKSSIARAVAWFRNLPPHRKNEVRQFLSTRQATTSRYIPRAWSGTTIEYAYCVLASFNYQLVESKQSKQLSFPF